jgi:phosphate transport system substrate-binding protein
MKTLKNKLFITLFIGIAALMNSCNQAGKTIDETPTRGNIKIGIDDSYRLLFDTELFVFESTYHYAHIKPIYKPELDILDAFIKDSIRTMISCRELSKNEKEYLTSKQIVVRSTKIAHDAIAFIINKKNTDTTITYNQIKDIFTGKIDNWKLINKKSKEEKIKVVFDNDKSGNVRFVVEKLNLPNKFPQYCSAVKSNEEVVNYVEGHPNAIGIVSVNWISDRRDSVSHSFLSKIAVVAVSNEIEPDGGGYYYRPYQGYVADKSYPFIRDVYVHCRESFSGLGSGFASFIAGDIGQRIILKSGMVPATMPIRLVQIKNN